MNRPEDVKDRFEKELARELRRIDAPKDFAAGVMERAAAERTSNVREMPERRVTPMLRMWSAGAIAAALVLGIFVSELVHERSQERKAAEARQQFEAAMRVTDHALDQTRAQLERAGLWLGE